MWRTSIHSSSVLRWSSPVHQTVAYHIIIPSWINLIPSRTFKNLHNPSVVGSSGPHNFRLPCFQRRDSLHSQSGTHFLLAFAHSVVFLKPTVFSCFVFPTAAHTIASDSCALFYLFRYLLISPYQPPHSLWSSDQRILSVPSVNLCINTRWAKAQHGFSYSAPVIWNVFSLYRSQRFSVRQYIQAPPKVSLDLLLFLAS